MRAVVFVGLMLFGVAAFGQDTGPIEVARLPSYTEGPTFDNEGNLFVSEPFGNNVTRIGPDGESIVWAVTAAPNGHRVLPNGTHLLCDEGAVLHMDRQGDVFAKTTACGSKPVRLANDLAIDPYGGFYFTDPGPPVSFEKPVGRICHSDAAGNTRLVADKLPFPNGVVLRPDGRTLLVSLSGASQIVEFPVVEPGVAGEMKILVGLDGDGVDGLALDAEGNLYFAASGPDGGYVGVVGLDGELKNAYRIPMADVSNLVFGGSNSEQLWITGRFHPIDASKPISPQMGPDTGKFGLVYRLNIGPAAGVSTPPSTQ